MFVQRWQIVGKKPKPEYKVLLFLFLLQALWPNVTMSWEIVTSCRCTASLLLSTWSKSAPTSPTGRIRTPWRQTRPRAAPATPSRGASASSGCASPRATICGWRSAPQTLWAWWSGACRIRRACLPPRSAGFSQGGRWQTGCAWTNSTFPGTT